MHWTIIFHSDAFWQHAPEHYLPLRILYDLLCTCRSWRDEIPVQMAMKIMYRPAAGACYTPATCWCHENLRLGASRMLLREAKYVFGLTNSMLSAVAVQAGRILFLDAFNIAHANDLRVCMRRKSRRKMAVARLANYRAQQRKGWVDWVAHDRRPWQTWQY